jgi:uridine kinase
VKKEAGKKDLSENSLQINEKIVNSKEKDLQHLVYNNFSSKRGKVLSELTHALMNIAEKNKSSRTTFLGISGYPGAGKTTLAIELSEILKIKGFNIIVVHQDDFRIAKKERLDNNGNFLYEDMPFIHQWHNWKDLQNLLYSIKDAANNSKLFAKKYESETKKRTGKIAFVVNFSKPIIVLIEGAFIFDLGNKNVYGIAPDAINRILDCRIFVFRGSMDKFDDEHFKNVLVSRKLRSGDGVQVENELRKQTEIYVNVINESLKYATDMWKSADFFFDNANFDDPLLKRNGR